MNHKVRTEVRWHEPESFKRLPWKNEGGETLELIKILDPNVAEGFHFRLSMACLDKSGPFSLFPGIDRILLLISGSEINLHRADNTSTRVALPLEPIYFKGEELIFCQVTGKAQDFNVMIKRTWGQAQVKVLRLSAGQKLLFPEGSFVFQLQGDLAFEEVIQTGEILWEIKKTIEVESKTNSTSIMITIIPNDNRCKVS